MAQQIDLNSTDVIVKTEPGGGGGVMAGGEVKLLGLGTAIHNMKLSPQNSFGELHSSSTVRLRALRELNASQALPVYLVFEREKSKGKTKNWSSKKIILKRPQG